MEIELTTLITCPVCRARDEVAMPTDTCQILYQCPGCQAMLRPLDGDCCIACSYGSVPCPPIQIDRHGAATSDRVTIAE